MATYYSQKSGDFSGDNTVWNTARDGSGSSGVPGASDTAVIQSGHTLTMVEGWTVGALSVESGGALDMAGYPLAIRGNLTNAGTVTASGPVVILGTSTITLTADVEFLTLIVVGTVTSTDPITVTRELRVEGSATVAEVHADPGEVLIAPGGSLTVTGGSAEAETLIVHGTLSTTPTFYYSKEYIHDGDVTGTVEHTSSHSSAQTITIDEDGVLEKRVSEISITRDPLRAAVAKVTMENRPEAREYLLGEDTLLIKRGGTDLFRGKIWKREVDEDTVKLTAYDHLFDLGKLFIPSWIYGNFYDDKVMTVNSSGNISVPGVSSHIVPPAGRIRFLRTRAKNLMEDSTQYVTVGYDSSGVIRLAAQYYELPEDAGRIWRFAIFAGTRTSGGDFKWWIYDVTPGSPNYDSIIANGTIPNTDISTGAPGWVVIDVADDYGVVPAPRKIKLVIGDNDDHANWSTFRWHGTIVSAYHPNSCKTVEDQDPTEDNLEWYTTAYGTATVGLWLSSEIECSGDWNDERDPLSEFLYGSATIYHVASGAAPISMSNRTRDNGDGTRDVARVTIFYDPLSPTQYLQNIVNDWGRYAFSDIDVSITDPGWSRPYLLIENASVLAVLRSLAQEYMAEFWHVYEASEDVFRARDKLDSGDWSSYSSAEQDARRIISPRAAKGYGPIDRAEYERLIKRRKVESAEELIRRLFMTGDGPAAYSDLSAGPPFYSRGEKIEGLFEEQIKAGDQVLSEAGSATEDRAVDGVDIYATLLHTNELVQIVDDLSGISTVAKVTRVEDTWKGGEWRTKVRANDAVRDITAYAPGWWKQWWGPVGPGQYQAMPGRYLEPRDLRESLKRLCPILAVWDLSTSCPSGTYYIHLGTSNASPGSNTMQTTDSSEKLVARAERVVYGGKVYLRAVFDRNSVQGEWADHVDVKEIGVSTSATWGSSILTRIVLDVPSVAVVGYAGDLITTSKTIYHPPVPLTSEGKLVVIVTMAT